MRSSHQRVGVVAPDRRSYAARSYAAGQGGARHGGVDRRGSVDRRRGAGASAIERREAGRRDGPSRRAASSRTAPSSRPRAGLAAGARLAPGIGARRSLLLVVFLLLTYGLVMSFSASAAEGYFEHKSSFYFLLRQGLFAGIGVAVMLALSRIDYGMWRRWAKPLAALALLGLVAVLVPGVGTTINGARRWIMVGGITFQPSEVAKLAAVVLIATLVARRPGMVTTARGFLSLAGLGIAPAAALIMLEPDLGTTLVLTCAVVGVLIAAGALLRHLLAAVGAACLVILGLIVAEPYRLERLTTFFDPWKDPQGSGFQATQSLISVASGVSSE